MRITYNESSNYATRQIRSAEAESTKTREKLSSGQQINHAGDDAAGLAVSERMASRYKGLVQARNNAQDAATLLQVAGGAYDSVTEMVHRIRTLAVQAANDSNTDTDRALIQVEVDELIAEVDRIGTSADYNGKKILRGTTATQGATPATWSSLGTPWAQLVNAVTNLSEGNQEVEFTFSFIQPGTTTDTGTASSLEDQADGSVNNESFKQEVRESFAEWEKLFESVFNTSNGYKGNLSLVFTDLGDETGTSVPSGGAGSYSLPHAQNIGDIRIGMEPNDGSGNVLAHGFSPGGTPGVTGTVGGDNHFDEADDWRIDETTNDGDGFSIKMVAIHEIGHNLGIGHDTNAASIMDSTVSAADSFHSLFPNGLENSAPDRAAIVGIYGGGGQTETRTAYEFHVGAEEGEEIEMDFYALNSANLGISGLKVRSQDEAEESLTILDKALTRIAGDRAQLGAVENRIQSTIDFTAGAAEKTAAARSNIADTNFASTTTAFTKEQILAETRLAALSQANIIPQSVLSLLQ